MSLDSLSYEKTDWNQLQRTTPSVTVSFEGFKGALSQTQIDALDTSSYVKGDWIINSDIPTIQLWDGSQWV